MINKYFSHPDDRVVYERNMEENFRVLERLGDQGSELGDLYEEILSKEGMNNYQDRIWINKLKWKLLKKVLGLIFIYCAFNWEIDANLIQIIKRESISSNNFSLAN